jgi:DNA-binding NarL/FixJ family response regulator
MSMRTEIEETCEQASVVTVAIVDGQPLFAAGLAAALDGLHWVSVVGIGSTADDARYLAKTLSPNIMFLDVQLPDSARTVRALSRRCRNLKVIAVVAGRFEFSARSRDLAGIRGWMSRAANRWEFGAAIDRVYGGSSFTSPTLCMTHLP